MQASVGARRWLRTLDRAMYKLGRMEADRWIEHSYPAVYEVSTSGGGIQRLVVGVPGGDPEVFTRLVTCLEPPYYLLYVLHTPRGEGEAGRYQSPELSPSQFRQFISRFGLLLSQDARFDIWAYSPAEQATVVWDRHNQVFAHGPVARMQSELEQLGFSPGALKVPVPHEHHYRAELDPIAKELLEAFEWSYSPLRPEDKQ